MSNDNTFRFTVDAETNVRFKPGFGDTGTKVEIWDMRSATNKYCDTDLPAVYCPRCEYDRARVETDYNPEFGNEVTVLCHNCGLDVEDSLQREEARNEHHR